MKLYEYQGRELLAKAGIPTPKGVVVSSVEELDHVKHELTYPLVVKAQVLVGGRGKAGGIKFADDYDEARKHTQSILGMDIKGLTVQKVMLVQKLDFAKELYASVLIDRSSRQALFLVSPDGGVEIESVADDRIFRATANPFSGVGSYTLRTLTSGLGLEKEQTKQVATILSKLFAAFRENDAELVEINPLAITTDGNVVAADAKAVINDGALFRHKDLGQVEEDYTPLEREARASNIAFVQLDGNIGVIANGAGLTMATLDALNEFGGNAGVFLDLGGTDDPEQVTKAFRLMQKADPSVVLLNLFGGITKCDTVARGIKAVLDEEDVSFPIVTRIKGTNAEEANRILESAGLHTTHTLQEAAQKAVEVERGHVPKAVAARGGEA